MSLELTTRQLRFQPNDLLIWWTTQGDASSNVRTVEKYVDGKSMQASRVPGGNTIPEYIVNNLESRNGRNARGTVWGHGVDTTINEQLESKWKKNDDFHRLLKSNCGGVLFYAKDLRIVADNIGFVTDLDLNLILKE